jgi:hypothetical protein
MFNLQSMKSTLTSKAGRSVLIVRKYSPEILLVAGIAGGITAAVLAAKATLKAQDVIDEHNVHIEIIDGKLEDGQTASGQQYTQNDSIKDKAEVYTLTTIELAKLYLPSVGLGVLSLASILASHGIMTRRQVSLIAAFNVVSDGYASYRQRVIEQLGEDADRNFRHGLREEVITEKEVDENGKEKTVKKTVMRRDPQFKSVYARFFDEASVNWMNNPTSNLAFLKAQQNAMNDLLIVQGHLFLNEVYDALGIPRTKEGAVVGWIYKNDPEWMQEKGFDGFVDFDIYNPENSAGRDFVNGYNPSILLDFNVDGMIFEKI